jgi:hypothetical protein
MHAFHLTQRFTSSFRTLLCVLFAGGLLSGTVNAGGQIPGDCTQDGSLDLTDAACVLDHLFVGRVELPCESARANGTLLDSRGNREIDLTDAVLVLNHLFAGGPPPLLGRACVNIFGCPNTCVAPPPADDEPEVLSGVEGEQRTVHWQLAEGPLTQVTYDVIDGLAVTEGASYSALPRS